MLNEKILFLKEKDEDIEKIETDESELNLTAIKVHEADLFSSSFSIMNDDIPANPSEQDGHSEEDYSLLNFLNSSFSI